MIYSMIGSLKGIVTHKDQKSILLDVNGVGYLIYLPTETLEKSSLGEEKLYLTHLAVRENALDLYGFSTEEELEFFTLLLSISGIGPRSALAILSLAGPETLRKAVLSEDTGYLTKVGGIGRKSAEKIILELKGKLGAIEEKDNLGQDSEVLEALEAIGFSLRDSREVLKKIPPDIKNTNDRIKEAIKILGQK